MAKAKFKQGETVYIREDLIDEYLSKAGYQNKKWWKGIKGNPCIVKAVYSSILSAPRDFHYLVEYPRVGLAKPKTGLFYQDQLVKDYSQSLDLDHVEFINI